MKTPYKLYDSLVGAFRTLDISKPLFLDTETCGLYGKVRLVQMYQEGLEHAILVGWPNIFELMAKLRGYHNAYHNAHYDVTVLQQNSDTREVPRLLDDTFLLARLAYPDKEKFSLDAVMTYALGYDPYDRQHLDKAKLQKSKWDTHVLSDDQLAYAATDVYYMPAVWNVVSAKLEDPSYKLDMHVLRKCLDFQWNGMPVDKDRLFQTQ